MTFIGHDPARVRTLQQHVQRAVDHLARLPVGGDRLAADATSLARLVRGRLETD